MKVLVIATHPDDEVLGCGGVIQRHIKQRDIVDILIMTEAPSPEWSNEYRLKKIEEQKEIDELLDIHKRYRFNFKSLTLNTLERGRFNFKIHEIIKKEINPDIIYTHYNHELNEEHNLVSLATIIGTRIPNKSTIYMYESPSARFSLVPFKPNYYVSLTLEQIAKKIECFELYKSEIKISPHPRSSQGIFNLAQYRGYEVGLDFAEAFIQVRRFWL